MNVDVTLASGKLGDLLLELFDLGALLADNDAGPCGMDIDFGFVRRALDFDARDTRVIEPALEKFFHPKIFMMVSSQSAAASTSFSRYSSACAFSSDGIGSS